jgi:phosphohistidine phosphatase
MAGGWPLSRRLFLLRHAKSSHDDSDLSDHDRPLAPRGRRAAGELGDDLRRTDFSCETVLCSTARRAVETLDRVRHGLPAGAEVEVDGELYGADADELLERVRRLSGDYGSAMLIGHNPGMEELALALAGGGDSQSMVQMRSKYPTCALACLAFDGDWSELTEGSARLEAFVVPRRPED